MKSIFICTLWKHRKLKLPPLDQLLTYWLTNYGWIDRISCDLSKKCWNSMLCLPIIAWPRVALLVTPKEMVAVQINGRGDQIALWVCGRIEEYRRWVMDCNELTKQFDGTRKEYRRWAIDCKAVNKQFDGTTFYSNFENVNAEVCG